jgi:hypothetical protein
MLKHNAMKMNGEVEIRLHLFLTPVLGEGEGLDLSPDLFIPR